MENIRVYIDKLLEIWNGLTRTQKIAAGGGGAVLLIFLLLLSFRGRLCRNCVLIPLPSAGRQ